MHGETRPDDDPLARLRAHVGSGDHEPDRWLERAGELARRFQTDRLLRTVAMVALGVVVVGATAAALAWNRAGRDEPAGPATLDLPFAPTSVAAADQTPAPVDVVVHAAGAVAQPGIYRLAPSARVADLVDAAGGLAVDADLDRLNLAGLLVDGGRVYVPRRGETDIPTVVGDSSGGVGQGTGTPSGDGSQLIDLNQASPTELEQLPGIGPATSAAIVAHRDRHGPFRSVDDLIDVRGIGPAKMEQLRDLVRV